MTEEETMDCREALRRMLEADPGEMEPGGEGDLARHLSSCGRCSRAAGEIRAGTAALDAWLSAPGTLDVDALVARGRGDVEARGRAAGGLRPTHSRPALPGSPLPRPRRSTPRLRRGLRWALPAAAAATAVLLLGRGDAPRLVDERGRDGPSAGAAPASTARPLLDLEVPAGHGAAVFATDDSDITVVWFFTGDET